jgi:hypothetical protein
MSNPPTQRDLLLAILAMDSYNRGYDKGIDGSNTRLSDSGQLGIATIRPVTAETLAVWKDAGFYAIAYQIGEGASAERIIAFRGTDKILANPLGSGSGTDFWTYGLGIGQPFSLTGGLTAQARLTIEFYRAVAGDGVDPFAANITTTGHSLGGGLAGYAAMLYGKQSTIFANMAFENSALATRGAAIVGSMLGIDQTLVYGDGPIYSTNREGISAFAVYGEVLGYVLQNRAGQNTTVDPLYSNGGLRNPVDLHSMALHTVLLWNQVHGNQNWIPAGEQLWITVTVAITPLLFDGLR